MKKQFLVIAILTLVIFSSVKYAFAQDPYLAPTPLTCIDLTDALRPVPGNKYLYDIDVPTPPGTKTYRWFVTTDTEFMSGATITATPEDPDASTYLQWAADHYDAEIEESVANSGDTISLRWNSFTLDPAQGEYLFVVVHVVNVDAVDCETNNLKVYRILPTHAFTLDIAAIDPTDPADITVVDQATTFEVCADYLQSAVFDPTHGTDGGVVYDFGQNTFYWIVSAANFTTGYQLSIQFRGLQGPSGDGNIGQEATLYWSDTFDGEENSITFDWQDGDIEQVLGNILGAASQDGQMLYIKVVIDHNHFEASGAGPHPYELAIDGVLLEEDLTPMDPVLFGDLHHAEITAGDGCETDEFDHDRNTQNLKSRPTVTPEDPTPFLPIGPQN